MDHEKEITLLENIQKIPHISQRSLAEAAGLSLGMTNAIIKRLAKKGWVIIKKINNRNIRYAVTSEGFQAITRRSFSYLKRTLQNVVDYKEILQSLLEDVAARGYGGVILSGKSDLDFMIEHFCRKNRLDYLVVPEGLQGTAEIPPGSFGRGEGWLIIYGENQAPEAGFDQERGRIFLQNVLTRSGS
jgi:predicted transcriptional regulator